MQNKPNRSPVFFNHDGRPIPVNRAARRELQAQARKTTYNYTKKRTLGRKFEREPALLVELRRKLARKWRSSRQSRLQGIMGSGILSWGT